MQIIERNQFQGCFVATLTPFDTNDNVDYELLARHVDWLISSGAQGLCPAGTTGEFLFLSLDEKKRVVATAILAAKQRVRVIAGVWGLREQETIELTQAAEQSGADAVFLPPPIYYPTNDDSIYRYYKAVREASSLPVFAYNIPQYAANEISISCLERLFAEGIIAGVKDSSGKAERVSALIQKFGADGVIYAASDGFASESRRLGADGFISAIANVTPTLFAKLWAGDDSLQAEVSNLRQALKQVGSIPALKYLLSRQGFEFGHTRQPYSNLSPEQMRVLDSIAL